MSGKILSAPLTKPPEGADRLTSGGNMLAAWRYMALLYDKDEARDHFALYSPAWRWRAYRWNEQYGAPQKILLAPPKTVWAYTSEGYLMRLRLVQNGEAVITTKVESGSLFRANENECFVKSGSSKIDRLCFSEDGEMLSRTNLYTGANPVLACFLSDGAIAIFDGDALAVLSPEGSKVHEETLPSHHYSFSCQSFILHGDHEHCCYTDDPRKGWRKTNVLNMHRKRRRTRPLACFFTVLDDTCYLVVQDYSYEFYIYRFPAEESSEHAESVWGIKSQLPCAFAQHDRLICMVSCSPLSAIGDTITPANNGFLALDPTTATFYEDIPSTTAIQKISAWRSPSIHIPEIWGKVTPNGERYNAVQQHR